jgi:error-prone DNA polymerase
MAAIFAEIPESIMATNEIAARCTFDLTRDLGYRFPDFVAGHPGESAHAALARLCIHQLGVHYPNATRRAVARARLDQELALIEHHGLAGFFLLHRDILELARDVALEVRPAGSARRQLPPGRGRGSSVGSIVCYLTGLSHIDPIANNLFLGRFLNRDMASVPDIDLDFPRDIRERLIVEIIRRYGNEHAALVAAFPTFKARMAIRELGLALALPEADLTRLSRLADGWSQASDLQQELLRLPDGAAKLCSPRWRALIFLAAQAAGLPRHLSQHSGGMVVSAQPLIEMVPVVPAATPGRQICQWDKNSCADAGFVKIDLLGLGMLSAVEECVDLIARTAHATVDLSRIDFSDPAVYAEIQSADTVGTFQIESRAQMQSLLQTQPENLDDLTVQVALIRPGPVSGGAVHPYVQHRRARRADPDFIPPYDHPLLEPVLRETLGVVVFQEQVLEVAMALAGFTPGAAEALRRAMSRTRSREAMLKLWDQFRDGARARGVADRTIQTVFTKLIGFSNFGFPKAHSAAFAVLAYQSAWLRRTYPAQFLTALLNAQPMGFYPPASLVRDAQRRGVRVVSPCVNRSEAACTLTPDGAVRIGLGYVREVRTDAAAALVAERHAHGPFRDLVDLAARSALQRTQVAQLIRAGACDAFDQPRRAMLWQLPGMSRPIRHADHTQLTLALPTPEAPPLREQDRFERIVTDYETMGLTTGWHLITIMRPHLPADTRTARELGELPTGTRVCVAGMVTARQRPGTAKGILFLLMEDDTGMTNVIVYPDCYERHRAILRAEPLVVVRGRLERRDRNINVIAERIERIAPPADRTPDNISDAGVADSARCVSPQPSRSCVCRPARRRPIDLGHIRKHDRLGQFLDNRRHIRHHVPTLVFIHDGDVAGAQHPRIEPLAIDDLPVPELTSRNADERSGSQDTRVVDIARIGATHVPSHRTRQRSNPVDRLVAVIPQQRQAAPRHEDPMDLTQRTRRIEPMKRLSDKDRGDRVVRDGNRRVASITDAYRLQCGGQHRTHPLRRLHRSDIREPFDQLPRQNARSRPEIQHPRHTIQTK